MLRIQILLTNTKQEFGCTMKRLINEYFWRHFYYVGWEGSLCLVFISLSDEVKNQQIANMHCKNARLKF